jgi:hypothetical protein
MGVPYTQLSETGGPIDLRFWPEGDGRLNCAIISATDPKQPFGKLFGAYEIGAFQQSTSCKSHSPSLRGLVLGAGLCSLSAPAIAEVSDKILSIPGMWLQAILIGGLAILAGRLRWWLGLPFLILPLVIALATFGRRHDPEMAPAIIEDQGLVYFQYSYASAALAALLVGVGIWMGWGRRRRLKRDDASE